MLVTKSEWELQQFHNKSVFTTLFPEGNFRVTAGRRETSSLYSFCDFPLECMFGTSPRFCILGYSGFSPFSYNV